MIFLSPKPEKTSPRASLPPRHRPQPWPLSSVLKPPPPRSPSPAPPPTSPDSPLIARFAGSAPAPLSLCLERFSLAGKVCLCCLHSRRKRPAVPWTSPGVPLGRTGFLRVTASPPARTPGSNYHPGAFGSLRCAKPTLSAELSSVPVRTKPRENWTASTKSPPFRGPRSLSSVSDACRSASASRLRRGQVRGSAARGDLWTWSLGQREIRKHRAWH